MMQKMKVIKDIRVQTPRNFSCLPQRLLAEGKKVRKKSILSRYGDQTEHTPTLSHPIVKAGHLFTRANTSEIQAGAG